MIKAIIFDFWNVICTFDNNLFIEKIFSKTPLSKEKLHDLIYNKSNLPKLYEIWEISSNEFFENIKNLCELDINQADFIEAYTNIFTPIKSTFDLIKKLKNNYKLSLLSNTSEWDFNFWIKPIEIFDLFNTVTLSYEVKEMKPENKIYLDCLNKLKLNPNECIYIDDIKKYSDKATEIGMIWINYKTNIKLLNSLKSYNIIF